MEGWHEFIDSIKYMIEGTFHTNDMSTRESESALCDAIDALAEKNGLPPVNWEEDDAD